MTERNRKKLQGCNAELVAKLDRLLTGMEAAGFPMIVTDGYRTMEQQRALYSQGRVSPGKIVTNADGVVKKSNHQTGRAADCCFLDANGDPSWDLTWPWKAYGELGKALGLIWGGDWAALHDLPHMELPAPAGVPV